jgi:hypothetical protein
MTEPDATAAQLQAQNGKPWKDAPRTKEVVLWLPTFTATAEMGAMSRMWGGCHVRVDNEQGLVQGRRIAMHDFGKFQALWDGTSATQGK